MTRRLHEVSESIALLVANAAPMLAAIRIGTNRHVSGFLWRGNLLVTSDQALPASANHTIVLSTGALVAAQTGPRDPANDLASLRLDVAVPAAVPEAAPDTPVGALVLALGASSDGSPTARLTAVHGRAPGTGMTLDLAGAQVVPGEPVIDAEGRLLGMVTASPDGNATVVPYSLIARFVEAASAVPDQVLTASALPLPPVSLSLEVMRPPGSVTQRRGWLGVSLQPITVPDNLAHRAGQRTARQVVRITRGGPADRAGLRSGDVLLALDGTSTSGNHALRASLAPERIGSEVEVRLMRDGLIHTARLTIAAPPEP